MADSYRNNRKDSSVGLLALWVVNDVFARISPKAEKK